MAVRSWDGYVLRAADDQYRGVTVAADDEAVMQAAPADFAGVLARSLEHWRATERRGVWLRVPLGRAELIPVAVAQGFGFHHTQAEYLLLNAWLTSDQNQMPNYATHYVGCAGAVINDKNEVLVVVEKYAAATNKWKVPGGLANPGESIVDAAIREVFEETGITSEFDSLLCVREKQSYLWGCADLYFVVRLRPTSTAISFPPGEIADCRWMPIAEFVALAEGTYPTQRAIARLLAAAAKGDSTLAWHGETVPAHGTGEPMRLFRGGP